MWSDPEAAGGLATTQPVLRRGHVWLVQTQPDRRQRAMVLLSPDRDEASDDPLLAAPLVRGNAAPGRVAVEIPATFDGAVIDLRRLVAIDPSALLQPIARLAAPRLAEVDKGLCDVLGLDLPAWPSADELERRLLAASLASGADAAPAPPDRVLELPATPAAPAYNGDSPLDLQGVAAHGGTATVDVPRQIPEPFDEPAPVQEPPLIGHPLPFGRAPSLDHLGFGPPPAPPPLPDATATSADEAGDGEDARGVLDEHPIAQLFGRPRPLPAAAATPYSFTNTGARNTPAAAVMPEILEIVQRRLHRSAPRLEAVLSQAADEGRSLEWAAAAVRHASVRGVMQSTLDEIAAEIAAVGARLDSMY